MSKKQFSASTEKLQKLDQIEKEINRRATALNNLEGFVFDIQNKLSEDEYIVSSTEDELEKIRKVCSEISDWLYDEGSEADADTYEKKIDNLHQLTRELFSRVWEHKERPEALKALHSMLNQSSHFLQSAKNLTKTSNPEKDIFTDVEIETLEKLITETTEWRDKVVKEQDAIKKYEPLKLTVKMLMDKMAALDREVKYLINKLKLWKPKKTDKPATNKSNTTDKNETATEEKVTDNKETEIPAEVDEEATVDAPETEENEDIVPSPTDTDSTDSHTEL